MPSTIDRIIQAYKTQEDIRNSEASLTRRQQLTSIEDHISYLWALRRQEIRQERQAAKRKERGPYRRKDLTFDN